MKRRIGVIFLGVFLLIAGFGNNLSNVSAASGFIRGLPPEYAVRVAQGYSISNYIHDYGQPKIKNGLLDLGGIGITNLEGLREIAGIENVTNLDLECNAIKEISEDAFIALSNLEHLDLEGNGIKTIQKNAFKGLSKLRTLYLRQAFIISTIDAPPFDKKAMGKRVVDRRGSTKYVDELEIDRDAFPDLHNLKYCMLDGIGTDQKVIEFIQHYGLPQNVDFFPELEE